MTDKDIHEGWEPCNPSECTQVWVMLAGDKLPAVKTLNHDMSVSINGEWISEQNWPILGIIPIRKAPPPEPIEFAVPEFHSPFMAGHLMFVPKGIKPGMRFREVQD